MADTPAPVSLPVNCWYCGKPLIVEYVAERDGTAWAACAYFDCAKTLKIGGASKIISMRADPLRNPRAF